MRFLRVLVFAAVSAVPVLVSVSAADPANPVAKFQQLDTLLPTPNAQRAASGAPGAAYWQNGADYEIDVALDDARRHLTGKATITYFNRSPDALGYLWLQLDQNYQSHNADSRAVPNTRRGPNPDRLTFGAVERMLYHENYDGEMTVSAVTDAAGQPLPHTIVKTMLRIDLPAPLASGASTTFKIEWNFPVNDMRRSQERTGYEFFEEDGHCTYTIAQWFPRLAPYTDYTGWQHKQFLGSGEFSLEFGNYTVRLTVPSDHIVGATGVLQNPDAVLTPVQRERLTRAQGEFAKPIFIVTPDEAKAASQKGAAPRDTKTWEFRAENVRDFAFASSRRFIWDAMAVEGFTHPVTPARAGGISDRPPVMAMSLYPKEGMPLWDKYSTHAIAHTIQVFSRYSFAYPYPVAYSVLAGFSGGMEYPMICFNGPRPETDGTYTQRQKYGLIGVVIHEVGHNYFPMIVNSDERQWTWMDEGLNSFLQILAQEEWEADYPQRRNERELTEYMRRTDRVPVMSNSESIAELGNNSYAQPAVALNVLREHVLGRELFDHAFKTYSQRWMFKRPTPADFFRTMEDASGVDLDWFWRGWFYGTDHVDVAIDEVKWLQLDTQDPAIEKPRAKAEKDALPKMTMRERNAALPKRVDRYPELKDFYDNFDETTVLPSEKKRYELLLEELKRERINPELLKTARNFYLIEFSNVGGLVTPLVLKIDYTDGTSEERTLPAEAWRFNTAKTAKLLLTTKELKAVTFDPRQELVDCNVENNFWPRRAVKTKFQLYKEEAQKNPMRELQKAAQDEAAKDAKKK